MASKLYRLTALQLRRIFAAVKWVESQPSGLGGGRGGRVGGAGEGFWAKLTSETSPGVYDWTMQAVDEGTLSDATGSDVTGHHARPVNDAEGLCAEGQTPIVWLLPAGYVGGDAPCYLFAAPSATAVKTKVIEVVTDVRCEDGEIVVDKEEITVIDDEPEEEP